MATHSCCERIGVKPQRGSCQSEREKWFSGSVDAKTRGSCCRPAECGEDNHCGARRCAEIGSVKISPPTLSCSQRTLACSDHHGTRAGSRSASWPPSTGMSKLSIVPNLNKVHCHARVPVRVPDARHNRPHAMDSDTARLEGCSWDPKSSVGERERSLTVCGVRA